MNKIPLICLHYVNTRHVFVNFDLDRSWIFFLLFTQTD